MRCQGQLTVTLPPGFDEDLQRCPNDSGWRLVTAASNATFCPTHIAGAVDHQLNQPDVEMIVIISLNE